MSVSVESNIESIFITRLMFQMVESLYLFFFFLGSFLLAASFLTSGENYKAQELFQAAAKGIFTDQFLEQRILRTSVDNPTKAYINYYLKVTN